MPIKIKKNQKRIILLTLIAIVVVGGIFWLTGNATNTKVATQPQVHSSGTLQPSPSSSDKAYAATAGGSASTPSTSGSSQLSPPTGQLLNLHQISLSANPGMESACQTTPNASCEIKLTQAGVTRTISAKNTGSSGIVLFDWTAQGLGLSTGQWTIQAVATQNGQSGTSANDYLTVNP